MVQSPDLTVLQDELNGNVCGRDKWILVIIENLPQCNRMLFTNLFKGGIKMTSLYYVYDL